ncbi:hypothetical protein [Streptomyces buecherae]|nr:hypothetical protein [Streptomyces buecherae]QNJ42006.1 hypothetical protein H7H31_21230 [Streptomyces buecherae]
MIDQWTGKVILRKVAKRHLFITPKSGHLRATAVATMDGQTSVRLIFWRTDGTVRTAEITAFGFDESVARVRGMEAPFTTAEIPPKP